MKWKEIRSKVCVQIYVVHIYYMVVLAGLCAYACTYMYVYCTTIFNQIQRMLQSKVRNSIPGIFMNPI